jgi:general nucleoside transport system permease protein
MNFFSLILQTLRYCAPVAFGAVGESIVQRSGIINIGLEGIMLSSAYGATVGSVATGNVWLGLFFGIVVGVALALVSAVFTITLGQDQIVVGTALNLLSTGICGTLFEKSRATGKLLNLPALPFYEPLGKGNGRVDAILVLLIVSIGLIAFLVMKTPWGLKLRATGEYPNAVKAAGFSPVLMRYGAMAVGGLFGGLAGSYYALGIANSFATEMISGRGFIAIALVTFGRWKPGWIFLSAMMLGVFEYLQVQMQVSGSRIPTSILLALPYVATLVVLVVVGRGVNAPASLGKPLEKI